MVAMEPSPAAVRVLRDRLSRIKRYTDSWDVEVPRDLETTLNPDGLDHLALSAGQRLRRVLIDVVRDTERHDVIEYFSAARWPWEGEVEELVRTLGPQHPDHFARNTLEPVSLSQAVTTFSSLPTTVLVDIRKWLRWLGRRQARSNYQGRPALKALGFTSTGMRYPGRSRLQWTTNEIDALDLEAIHFGHRESYVSEWYVRLPWSDAVRDATRAISRGDPDGLKVWIGLLALPHQQRGAFRFNVPDDALHWSWRYHRRLLRPREVARQRKKIEIAVELLQHLNAHEHRVAPMQPALSIREGQPDIAHDRTAQAWIELHDSIQHTRRSVPFDLRWFQAPESPPPQQPFRLLLFLLDRWSRSRKPHRQIIVTASELREAFGLTPEPKKRTGTQNPPELIRLEKLVEVDPVHCLHWEPVSSQGEPSYRIYPPPGWILRAARSAPDISFLQPATNAPVTGADLWEWQIEYEYENNSELARALERNEKYVRDQADSKRTLDTELRNQLAVLARERIAQRARRPPWDIDE